MIAVTYLVRYSQCISSGSERRLKTKIQKWGNSLGLRIPKAFAEEANVQEGSIVDVAVENGHLVVRRQRTEYDLASLVASIKPENLHGSIDTGPARGRESW